MKKIFGFMFVVSILFSCSSFAYADISSWINYPDFIIDQYQNEHEWLIMKSVYCEFPDTSIKVRILPDGSAWFTETRRVFFHDFPDTELCLLFPYEKGMTIDHLQVREPGKTTADKSDIYSSRSKYFISWDFPTSGDEYKTFIISYHVKNAILVHKDIADFNWGFINRPTYTGIRHLTISIELPSGAEKNEVMAWGHGWAYGKFKVNDSRHIFCEMKYLRSSFPLEGRIVFPRRLIQKGGIYQPDNALPLIRAKEAVRARHEIARKLVFFVIQIISLFSLISLTILFNKKQKAEKTLYICNREKEQISKVTPAIAQFYYLKLQDPFLTILNLIQRGILIVELYRKNMDQDTSEYLILVKRTVYTARLYLKENSVDSLLPYERLVLDCLLQKDESREISFYRLRHIFGFSAKMRWGKTVKNDAEKFGLFEKSKKMNISWISFVLIAFAFMSIVVYFASPTLQILYYMNFSLAISIIDRYHGNQLSPKGFEVRNQLSALRKYFVDFSKGETSEVLSLKEWNQYLPYAVALKTEKAVIRQLVDTYPEIRQALFAQFSTSDIENQETPSDLTTLITMITLIDPKYVEKEIHDFKESKI